jgi:hypothetical protein
MKFFTSTDLEARSVEVNFHFDRLAETDEIFHFDQSGGQIGRSELSLLPAWLKMMKFFTLTDLEARSVEVNFHFDRFPKKKNEKKFHFQPFRCEIDQSEFLFDHAKSTKVNFSVIHLPKKKKKERKNFTSSISDVKFVQANL